MDNFYLIDKPIWVSSFSVIKQLRKKFNIKKMWHTWTLDPLATWAVLVATWNYTKLIPYLEKESKQYEFSVMLDGTTESLDLAEIINYISIEEQEKFKTTITLEHINKLISKKFIWKITQIPPKYSALKIDWKRAYELARKWEDVEMKSREIEIFEHEIISFSYPEIQLRAKVSAGTYIRTIAWDIWEELWTWWYISKLRRTHIWNLSINESSQLETIIPDETLWVDRVLDKKYFLENFDSQHISRLNDWLERIWKFELEINVPYFIYNWSKITNIVKYDGEKLIPIKKVC